VNRSGVIRDILQSQWASLKELMSGEGWPGKIGKVKTGTPAASEKSAYSELQLLRIVQAFLEHFSSILKALLKKRIS
jgi:hypothetical protein